jgi:hypothetical protein
MLARAQNKAYDDKSVKPAQKFEPDVDIADVEPVQSHRA